MKFYTFGNRGNPVILLLPGTCCHWRANFGAVIPLLESCFYVVCASYDGFDETEPGAVFLGMTEETQKIEQYINENFGGHISAAYGCSLGGSFVGLLIQRKQVRIDHGILGSSDLDQSSALAARLQTAIVTPLIARMLHSGRLPGFMKKKLEKLPAEDREYYDKMLELFGVGSQHMAFVKKESIKNQFYSDLVTPLACGISADSTAVHCFWAVKMGEKYLNRYLRHFPKADIRRHDLQHEELLMRYPEKWLEEIKLCCQTDTAGSESDVLC